MNEGSLAFADEAQPDRHVPEVNEGMLAPNFYCRGWNGKRQKYCSARAGAWTDHPGVGRCKFHGGNQPVVHGTASRYAEIAHARLRELVEQFEHDPDPLNIEPEIALLRAMVVDFIERYGEMSEALLAWHESWQAEMLDLPEDRIMDFEAVVNEYEILLAEGPEPTDKQKQDIESAKTFLSLLRKRMGSTAGRPRKILDIADAHRIVDTIAKAVERVEKVRAANAISRKDLFRVIDAMGREVMKHVTDTDTLKRIREGWLNVAIT